MTDFDHTYLLINCTTAFFEKHIIEKITVTEIFGEYHMALSQSTMTNFDHTYCTKAFF